MKLANLIFAGCLAAYAFSAQAAEFYVAPNGRDDALGTKQAPFATIARARDAVRSLRAGKPASEAVTVYLREGIYFLPQTLEFGPDDSGSEQFPVVYTSAANERAVVSGGRPIGGLSEVRLPDGQRAWKTVLPEAEAGRWYFRQLFACRDGNGEFGRRYRPHLGMFVTAGLTYSPSKPGMAHRAAQKDFLFFPGDLKSWHSLSDVELVALHTWSSSRLLIEKLDLERTVVEFTGFPTFRIGHWWKGGRNPYYVENVREALTAPGQWYLDRASGEFLYLPLEGETLANTKLVAPALTRIVAVNGDWAKARPVAHVAFRNLTFCHNESPLPKQGYGGSQAQPDLPAAIELTGARQVLFDRCTVAHVGNYGMALGRGCRGNRIVGCRFADLAGGGIKVGDIGMNVLAKPPELPTDNVVENCAISDGGLMYFSANAIWAGIVNGLKLQHNEIWNFPYAGIAVGWKWDATPTSCGNNLIADNLIHDVCTLLADGASIYTLGRQPGTVIRGNVLRDNRKSKFTQEHWQLGVYLDEGSSEILVENNLLYHVGTHGFNLNGGADNTVRNNIFGPVYGNHGPFHRCHKRPFSKGNVFERNITWCDSPNLADTAWEPGLMLCRSNLYWNVAGAPFSWKDKDFGSWQASGQDAGSLLADPQFVDPQHGDFHLRPTSPALRLGFKPFDYTLAGLEPAYHNIKVAVATTPAPAFGMELPVIAEPPPGFKLDFEDVPLGIVPRGFSCNGCTAEVNFQVAEESAHRGKRALRVVDAKAAAKSFFPYLTYHCSKPLEDGKVRFACAVRLKPEAPLMLDFVFRDYTRRNQPKREFTSGPSVQFLPDGRVTTGGNTMAKVPPGQWATLEIEFDLTRRTGMAKLQTDGDSQAVKRTLDLPAEFTACSWFGIVAGQAIDGVAYLDDMQLTHTPARKE